MGTATRRNYSTKVEPILHLALELGDAHWKLGFTTGFGQKPRLRTIGAGDIAALEDEVALAKKRFRLKASCRVVSCYEAGRDGFWIHRCLGDMGIENVVVDSSSIEVNRRKRRAKTDRLDVGKLVTMLVRYHSGETKVWSVVRVPSEADEDRRNLHRSLGETKRVRVREINRIKGLLKTQGVAVPIDSHFLEHLERERTWDERPLPPLLVDRVKRSYARHRFFTEQIYDLEKARRAAIRFGEGPILDQVRQLKQLRGIGINSSWLFVMEFFGWREFRNRREVGSLSGLTPTPYNSGGDDREQGIGKDGNRHVRGMAVEIAWSWLRHQPNSELSLWYNERFGHGSSRVRRIGIVALARKLLIELWRYLETGELPAGAELKA